MMLLELYAFSKKLYNCFFKKNIIMYEIREAAEMNRPV